MRVTLGGYDGEPAIGGQGVLVRGLGAALERRGVELHRISGHGRDAVAYPAILHRPPLDLSIELNRHPAILLERRPDLVHLLGGPGGVLLLRRLPVPLVYTAAHTYRQAHSRRAPQRALSPLEARAYRAAAMVLAISPSTADAVLALGVPGSRVEVVMPGIDLDRFDRGDAERVPGRILFAGRLEPEKGPLDAVAAIAELAGRRTGISGVVLGVGSLDGAVRAAAAGAPLEVLGQVDDAALAGHFSRAEVVVVPSRYEGLGLVALEAMASGAAVVAYDVTGLRDAVAGRGTLVDPAAGVTGLVTAIGRLLDNPHRRAELTARARDDVRRCHSWDLVAARVDQIQRALVGSAAAG